MYQSQKNKAVLINDLIFGYYCDSCRFVSCKQIYQLYIKSIYMLSKNHHLRDVSCEPLTNSNNKIQQVKVYLRQINKFGIKICLPSRTTISELMTVILEHLKIPVQLQMIFLHSNCYTIKEQRIFLELQQNTIIHVHNITDSKHEKLQLYFQQIDSQGQILKAKNFVVKASTTIGSFAIQQLGADSINFIESGRKLDMSKTFQDEYICDGSTIYYTCNKSKLNRDQFQKDFNMLFEQQKNTQQQKIKQQKKDNQQNIASPFAKQASCKRKSGFEILSSGQIQYYSPQPNFKKKKQICIQDYRSCQRSSSECNKDVKNASKSTILASALKRKKKWKDCNNESNKSEQVMTQKAKIKLKQQFRKLFKSQNMVRKVIAQNNMQNHEKQQIFSTFVAQPVLSV